MSDEFAGGSDRDSQRSERWPDLIIEVRRDIMDEADGPMLRHGLQG